MRRFEAKTVLITGGSGGIGLATALRIAREGGRVAVTGKRKESLDRARSQLPADAMIIENDAGEAAAAPRLAQIVREAWGGLDGLFLNAGYGGASAAEATSADMFDRMTGVNVRGPILQMAALRGLLRRDASVLLTASIAAHAAQPTGAVYAASKGALTSVARCWAAELASDGIRVNSIAPGPTDTGFFDAVGTGVARAKATRDRFVEATALKRLAAPEEIAAVACFLLSGEASFVTGSQYVVDGGLTFR